MEISLVISYFLAILVGLLLGALGGGGSILALPIFVYILGIDPILATTYSLFVVGISSSIGAFKSFKNKLVDFNALIYFGIASVISVVITRTFILDLIPEIISLPYISLTKGKFIMLLFSVLMLGAAISMIINKDNSKPKQDLMLSNPTVFDKIILVLQGLFDGLITGLVGAGGGFLIVPTLVLISKIDVKIAVATSLAIISIKTIIGFISSYKPDTNIDFTFLIIFTFIAIVGIVIGLKLATKIKAEQTKKYFGYFLIIASFTIFYKEFIN